MNIRNILIILLLTLTKLTISQTSSVRGKVIDGVTGETLPGAVVMLEGTTNGSNTDLDGNFVIGSVAPGTYTVVCQLISYNTKKVSEVRVTAAEPVYLTITMESASNELGVVEVVTRLSTESNNALMVLQKNSATVADGVSAEGIKRTPDKSTSDVLKRVSGASVQDNKFVVVRGLNDRYNAAYLNGAPLPSSEPDRKAFSFDIFPSAMLDNLLIVKTASPDQPGEFAGGIIQINTKGIPEKTFTSVAVGAGYNTITTGRDQVTYNGGQRDWLGIDDGTRALPAAIPEQDQFPMNINQQAILARSGVSDWSLNSRKFSPNYSLQAAGGVLDSIFGKQLGIIFALTYNKSNSFTETINRTYSGNGSSNTTASQLETDYLTKNFSEQVLTGLLGNLSYKLNDNHTISFKNLYSINSDDRVLMRTGKINPLDPNPSLLRANALWFTSNRIYSGQLSGEHTMGTSRLKINWNAGLSTISRSVPNLRRNIYTRFDHFNDPSDPYLPDTMYSASIAQTNVGPDYGGGMFFSENKENIYSLRADLSYALSKIGELATEIKAGAFVQSRDRKFFARQLGYTRYGISGGSVTFKDSLLYLPEDQIFSEQNMGLLYSGAGGFKLTDGTKPSDKYEASSSLTAGYLMFDNKLKFARLVWGLRVESFNQKLFALKGIGDTVNIDQTVTDLLPSANLILAAGEKQNFRLSYYRTINRPEYRELAPFAFYDFTTGFVTTGNDSLQRATINNADFRYEYFPGRGQMLSASLFYKQFNNPIEMAADPSFDHQVTYRNVTGAINYGLEIEFRTLIGSLLNLDSSKFFNNLTLFSNLAIVRSNVDVSKVRGATTSNRSLQGTSPYVFNAGLLYLNQEQGYSVSVSFNQVGPRIAVVGSSLEPEIWENSRAFLDLQLTKSLLKNRMEIKLNAQNILAQDQEFYQNRDLTESSASGAEKFFNSIFSGSRENSNGFDKTEDDLYSSMKTGRVISLGISYKF
jgi:TonB-dependent receptor